jgi:hypothetical protein
MAQYVLAAIGLGLRDSARPFTRTKCASYQQLRKVGIGGRGYFFISVCPKFLRPMMGQHWAIPKSVILLKHGNVGHKQHA